MRTSFSIAAFAVCLCVLPVNVSGADLESANKLYRERKYAQALDSYRAVLESEPDNHVARYMAAQSANLIGKHREALDLWLGVEEEIGDADLRLKEKLIQAYEKLDNTEEVDRRLKSLIELRRKTDDQAYKRKRSFCRDQFSAGGDLVLAHHHFDFPEKDDTCFTFYCFGPDDRQKSAFKFWRMPFVNELGRETGDLKEGESWYDLDEQSDGRSISHMYTKKQLPYREVKKLVVGVLQERADHKSQPQHEGCN